MLAKSAGGPLTATLAGPFSFARGASCRSAAAAIAVGGGAACAGAARQPAGVIALGDTGDIWGHLIRYVIPTALVQTALLLAGVAAVTVIAGVGTAWAVTTFAFPGRDALTWLLPLPLAIPTYIVAYVYVDILDALGPVQSALRALFGWQSAADYWFPNVRSLGGAIFVMGFVLYPVRLSRRARDVPDPGRAVRRSRAHARRAALAIGAPHHAAAGAAGDRGRSCARAAWKRSTTSARASISACRR